MKKRILALALSCALAVPVCFTACGKAKDNIVIPTYQTDEELMICGWNAPISTVADYQLAKDMGLTHMFIDEDLGIRRGTAAYAETLNICEQVGMKAIITVGNFGAPEEPAIDTFDYSQFPAVEMINWWDEPHSPDWSDPQPEIMDQLAAVAEEHMRLYPDNNPAFLVNLLGYIAYPDYEGDYFQYYLDKVASKITTGKKILSFTAYPMSIQKGVPALERTYLANLELAATTAKDLGAIVNFFMQSVKFAHDSPDEITLESMRFQFNCDLTYGVRGFTYFTYRDALSYFDYGRALVSIDVSGATYPAYHIAKQVNLEVKALQHIFLNFDWLGTMPVVGSENDEEGNLNFEGMKNPLQSIPFIKGCTATQDTIIGQFVDGEGRDGLMVTNFTNPYNNLSDTVRIEFKNAKKVACYINGVEKIYNLSNNTLKIKLAAGEGVFMIPLA